MPFFRALVDIQQQSVTGNSNSVRANLIRSGSWVVLMDKLHAIHRNGRTLVHPKIVKLLEVSRRWEVDPPLHAVIS